MAGLVCAWSPTWLEQSQQEKGQEVRSEKDGVGPGGSCRGSDRQESK